MKGTTSSSDTAAQVGEPKAASGWGTGELGKRPRHEAGVSFNEESSPEGTAAWMGQAHAGKIARTVGTVCRIRKSPSQGRRWLGIQSQIQWPQRQKGKAIWSQHKSSENGEDAGKSNEHIK